MRRNFPLTRGRPSRREAASHAGGFGASDSVSHPPCAAIDSFRARPAANAASPNSGDETVRLPYQARIRHTGRILDDFRSLGAAPSTAVQTRVEAHLFVKTGGVSSGTLAAVMAR